MNSAVFIKPVKYFFCYYIKKEDFLFNPPLSVSILIFGIISKIPEPINEILRLKPQNDEKIELRFRLILVKRTSTCKNFRFQFVSLVSLLPRNKEVCSSHVSVSCKSLVEFAAVFSRKSAKIKLFDDCCRS